MPNVYMAVVPLCAEHFVDEGFKEIPKIVLSADGTCFGWTDLQAASEHLKTNLESSLKQFQTRHRLKMSTHIVHSK
jgi:hypothetical protein